MTPMMVCGKAKIAELEMAGAIKEEVVRLNVAMYEAQLICRQNSGLVRLIASRGRQETHAFPQ